MLLCSWYHGTSIQPINIPSNNQSFKGDYTDAHAGKKTRERRLVACRVVLSTFLPMLDQVLAIQVKFTASYPKSIAGIPLSFELMS